MIGGSHIIVQLPVCVSQNSIDFLSIEEDFEPFYGAFFDSGVSREVLACARSGLALTACQYKVLVMTVTKLDVRSPCYDVGRKRWKSLVKRRVMFVFITAYEGNA